MDSPAGTDHLPTGLLVISYNNEDPNGWSGTVLLRHVVRNLSALDMQRSDVETRRLMEFQPRLKKPCDHAGAIADVQFASQHAPVESVGDLKGPEVRGDAGYVPGNPGLKGGVGLIRVILFNQPASPGDERGNEPCQAYRQDLPRHADATYVNLGTTFGSPEMRDYPRRCLRSSTRWRSRAS